MPVELAQYRRGAARGLFAFRECPGSRSSRSTDATWWPTCLLRCLRRNRANRLHQPHRSQRRAAEAPVTITDSLVDEVTRRVVERLAPEAANELVAQIVSEVAERLIREEITRIKAAAAARL